jgi:hypothetical protein
MLKTKMGLAVAGALLASAVLMSSLAGAAKFEAAEYPAQISGSITEAEKFTIGGGTLTCKTSAYSGELTAASEQLTLIPTYAECTAFGFVGATLTGFGSGKCGFLDNGAGWAALACVTGDVQVDAGTCTVTMESAKNQNLKNLTFTNNVPSAGKVTEDKGVTNIHAVVTSGFGCPIAAGTYTNASWSGKVVLIAKKNGVTVSLTYK